MNSGMLLQGVKSKINSDVIAKVGSVYAARSLAGGVGSYEGFLRQPFPLCLRLMKLKVCKERLQRNMDLGIN